MRFVLSILLIVLLGVRFPDAAEPETAGQVVQRLVSAARIYDKREMAAASNQLVRLKEEAVPPLASVLDDVDDNVRWQAILTLGRIGRPDAVGVTSRLVDACRDLDADVRGAAAVALGRLHAGTTESVLALRLLCHDEQPMVQADAWWALWQLQHEKAAVAALLNLLSSKDWLASSHASEHLSTIGPPAVPGLVKMLVHQDPAHSQQAGETLRGMGPRAASAIPDLLFLVRGKNRPSAAAAARVLGTQKTAAVAGLVSCLSSSNQHSRRLAIVALGEIGPVAEPAVPQLASKLKQTEGHELRLLVESLGRIGLGTGEVVTGLVRLLENKDQDIRGVACQALGRIGVAAEIAERHLERLAERDPVDFVRRAAERARARIRLSESRRTRAVRPPMPGKIAGKS